MVIDMRSEAYYCLLSLRLTAYQANRARAYHRGAGRDCSRRLKFPDSLCHCQLLSQRSLTLTTTAATTTNLSLISNVPFLYIFL
jgi:hypothetical protein